jgi:hypothetical protein
MSKEIEKLKRVRDAGRSRVASVFTCVLVVLLLVGMLCLQTTQSLLVIRRSDMQRAKLYQAREILEFAKAIDWEKRGDLQVEIAIPQSTTDSSADNLPSDSSLADVGPVAKVEVSKVEAELSADNPSSGVTRIVVYYPSEMPGEIVASWESKK